MEPNSNTTKSGSNPPSALDSAGTGNQSQSVRKVKQKCSKLQEKLNKMTTQKFDGITSRENENIKDSRREENIPSTSNNKKRSSATAPFPYVASMTKDDFNNDRIKIKEKIKNVKTKFAKMNLKFNGSLEGHYPQNESFKEKQRRRTNSERSSVITDRSEPLDVYRSKSVTLSTTSLASGSIVEEPTVDQICEESTKSRRKRKKRNGKNFKDERVMEDAYNLEITNEFRLNAETLLIIDLLSMSEDERQDFLVRLAKSKQILMENSETNNLELNPKIFKLKSILCTGKKVWEMNQDAKKRVEAFANSKSFRGAEPQKKEKSRPLFEELVNVVVWDGLSEEEKKKFTFPVTSRRHRTKNYVYSNSFTKSLEEFSQKCVESNLGVIIEGEIRVNAKNNDQAFIKNVHGEKDAMFPSHFIRKCALHGDIVRAFIRIKTNECNNKDPPAADSISPPILDALAAEDDDEPLEIVPGRNSKGFVIKILEEVHNRRTVGSFLSYRLDSEYITFVPRDTKMPNIRIYKENWPESFTKDTMEKIPDILYVAEIIGWSGDICVGKTLQAVGKCGELEAENNAILLQNRLTINAYDEKFNEKFYGPIILTEDEKRKRKDIRSECIFTIDPLTARDLDDAMSCKRLPNGNYEIAVHISDVTHFLEEDSELDRMVKQRTTSVYMVNEVFHMLPKPLCLKCSLLPGEDKLAFSVFWEITPEGEILSTNFCRSILNSCVQLAYEHAQKIIDNPERDFTENDFPMIHNGFTASDIVEKVNVLQSISTILRKKRFDNGALKINRPKLYFDLDPETGAPINYGICELNTANYLIEEFMLLANQSVAKYTFEKFPGISILRNHEPPLPNVIKDLKERLTNYGLDLDIKNSKAIYDSLLRLVKESGSSDIMEIVLSHLISKPMARAKYFCSESKDSERDFWHYALSIPIYTHFTSPIRRYPDILVHRVLSAALGYTQPPKRTPKELQEIAGHCNEHKVNAKNAGDDSANLYFLHYIKSKKSLVVRAAVLDMWLHAMEVILVETGHIVRISYPREGKNNPKILLNNKTKPITAQLIFANVPDAKPKELKLFAEISVEVFVEKNKLRGRLAVPPSTIPAASENASSSSCNVTETTVNISPESVTPVPGKSQNDWKGNPVKIEADAVSAAQFRQLESKTFYNNKLFKEIKPSLGTTNTSESSENGQQLTPAMVESILKGLETYPSSCSRSQVFPFDVKEKLVQVSDTVNLIPLETLSEGAPKIIPGEQLAPIMEEKSKELKILHSLCTNSQKSSFAIEEKSTLTSDNLDKSEIVHCIRPENFSEEVLKSILGKSLSTTMDEKSIEIETASTLHSTSKEASLKIEDKSVLVSELDKSENMRCIPVENSNEGAPKSIPGELLVTLMEETPSKELKAPPTLCTKKSSPKPELQSLVSDISDKNDTVALISSESPNDGVHTSTLLITLSSNNNDSQCNIQLVQPSEPVMGSSTEMPLQDTCDDYVDAHIFEGPLSSQLTLDTSEEGVDWVTPPTSPFI